MFSKTYFKSCLSSCSKKLLLSAFSVLLFSACNWPMHKTPPLPVAPDTGLGDTACLSALPRSMANFAAGTAPDAEVMATFDCMSRAIATFERSTQGRFEDRFTSKELTNFVRQYFLNEGTVVSDSLRTETFRIKQLFVGGANDSITRLEMKNLLSVIETMKQITLGLNPYTKVYFQHWQLSESQSLQEQMAFFEASNLQIQKAARDLGNLIQKNGIAYHLDNVVLLSKELSNLNGSNWTWIPKLEQTMPLVRKLKKSLTGGSESDVEPKEWTQFALLGGRGYIQYLRYYYFLESAPAALNEAQLFYITRSVDDLFLYLGDMVAGKPNQALTRQELLEILQSLTQFVPKLKISDRLLFEVMKIKVLLFGGELSQFAKADFDYARTKLETYHFLTGKLLDYSGIYALSWDPHSRPDAQAHAYFAEAEKNLIFVATRLGDSFETAYNLNDLIQLASAVDELYPDHRGQSYLSTAQKYVPVLIATKNILLSDAGSSIGDKATGRSEEEIRLDLRKHWGFFLSSTANLFSRYSYYTYFVAPLPKGKTVTSGVFQTLITDSISFLEGVISQKPALPIQAISFAEFHRLWGSLQQAQIMPADLKLSTLDSLTRILTQRFLNPPETRLIGKSPEGLTLTGLQTLRSELGLWQTDIRFFDQIYAGVAVDAGLPGTSILANLNTQPAGDAYSELKMIYNSPLSLAFDSLGRLSFVRPLPAYTRSTSDMINLIRTMVRLIIRSYAGEMGRITSYQGLTQPEFNQFFDDITPALVDLHIIDPSRKGFADNRFRDANLFSPFANGDDFADFREMSGLSLFLISGLKLDWMLQADLAKNCKITQPSENKNTWSVDEKCLSGFYLNQMDQSLASMPEFLNFKKHLTPEQYNELVLNILKSSGYVASESSQVHLSDLALFPHVIQYMENVYQIYDVNHDGSLDTDEAMKVYPIFKATLHKVSNLSGDTFLKGLFAWLLKNGKPPALSEGAAFTGWCIAGPGTWHLQADRAKLAQILGVIADAQAHKTQNLFFHIMDSTGSEVF